MRMEAPKLRGEFVGLDQSPDSGRLVEGRRGGVEARYGNQHQHANARSCALYG